MVIPLLLTAHSVDAPYQRPVLILPTTHRQDALPIRVAAGLDLVATGHQALTVAVPMDHQAQVTAPVAVEAAHQAIVVQAVHLPDRVAAASVAAAAVPVADLVAVAAVVPVVAAAEAASEVADSHDVESFSILHTL